MACCKGPLPFPALREIMVVVVGEGGGYGKGGGCCTGPHPASCMGSNGGVGVWERGWGLI